MSDDSRILPRHMLEELKDALQVSRIVSLVEPRQVGKTTLVRDQYGEGEFLTLDDEAVLSALETDADSHLVCIDVKATAVVKAEDFRHIK